MGGEESWGAAPFGRKWLADLGGLAKCGLLGESVQRSRGNHGPGGSDGEVGFGVMRSSWRGRRGRNQAFWVWSQGWGVERAGGRVLCRVARADLPKLSSLPAQAERVVTEAVLRALQMPVADARR